MITLLPQHGLRKSTEGHRSSLKNMMAIRSGDHIHLRIGMIVVVQTMVMMSKFCSFSAAGCVWVDSLVICKQSKVMVIDVILRASFYHLYHATD